MSYPVSEFEHERLSILRRTGLLDGEPNPILEAICDAARKRFGVGVALVTILEENEQLFKGRSGTDLTSTPRELAFCNYTILGQSLFVISDLQQDTRFSEHPMVVDAPYMRFYAGVPIRFTETIHLGAFCILDTSPGTLTQTEVKEMSDLAERVREEILKRISETC